MKNITAGISFLKVIFIVVLGLVLLIPLLMISSLVHERSQRKLEVGQEITSKWGQSQEVSGPVIAIPYEKEIITKVKEGNALKTMVSYQTEYLHLLPNKLQVSQDVKPETRSRGIYNSIVYTSLTEMKGDFLKVSLEKEGIKPEDIAWSKARLVMGVSDLKGLSSFPEVIWNGKKIEVETNTSAVSMFRESLSAPIDLSDLKSSEGTFSIQLNLRGSDFINISPLGRETDIHIKGKWGSPSFDGDYLPNEREVTKDSFEAKWVIQSLDRKIPQQWTSNRISLPYEKTNEDNVVNQLPTTNVVKVTFLDGVDLYQQTERTLKYGVLVIALAFLALFFTEIISKTPLHIIHYGLIGAALVIFYTLLLSISEHIGFNLAYLAAFLATNGIITWFVKNISKSKLTAIVFSGILTLFFGFNFVLMQLEDYSLLVGSIGLFIILAALMYVTGKINWFPKADEK
jgi:inner membrane protein